MQQEVTAHDFACFCLQSSGLMPVAIIKVFMNSNRPDEKFCKDCYYFIIISDDGHRFLLLLPLCIVSCGVISFAIVGSKYL